MSYLSMNSAVHRLRAIGEPTRLRLVHLLGFGELTVTEITEVLGQSQPRVSRHLKLLLEAGLIERFREGACVFYQLSEEKDPDRWLHALIEGLDDRDPTLAGDRERLVRVKAARAKAANAYFEANAAEWMRIRALYQPVAAVEEAMRELLGSAPVDVLIDLGTGTGRVLEALNGLYRKGIGLDISHGMLGLARVNLDRAGIRNAHVRFGNILSPPPVDPADVVVLHQVLHYLDQPPAAFTAAAGLLAPGGRLLVVDFLPHEFEILRCEHAHRRLGFADGEIQRLCRQSGLEYGTTRHLPPPADQTTRRPPVALWLAHRSMVGQPGRPQSSGPMEVNS